jgi:hypothetical protein
MKILIAIILCLSLIVQTVDSQPPAPKPKVAVIECAIALVVIVVGVVVWVHLYHLCKKVLPPDNDGGGDGSNTNSVETNSAAYFDLGEDSANDLDTAQTAEFTVTCSQGAPSISQPSVPAQTESSSNYLATLQNKYGLDVSDDRYPGYECFAVNGQPTNSLPTIQFENGVLQITNGSPTHLEIVQKMEGTNWVGILTNLVSEGLQLKIQDQDADPEMGLYRVVSK